MCKKWPHKSTKGLRYLRSLKCPTTQNTHIVHKILACHTCYDYQQNKNTIIYILVSAFTSVPVLKVLQLKVPELLRFSSKLFQCSWSFENRFLCGKVMGKSRLSCYFLARGVNLAMISINQLSFQSFPYYSSLQTVNYGTSLAYAVVNVQSDLIMPPPP